MGILDVPEWVDDIPAPGQAGSPPKLQAVLEMLTSEPGDPEQEWAKIARYKTRKSASASASYMRKRYGEDYTFASRGEEVFAKIK